VRAGAEFVVIVAQLGAFTAVFFGFFTVRPRATVGGLSAGTAQIATAQAQNCHGSLVGRRAAFTAAARAVTTAAFAAALAATATAAAIAAATHVDDHGMRTRRERRLAGLSAVV
jgi:hypothetical protein